mgnify:FL=1
MITLITGGPGLGKTALTVKLLITQYAGRPIFTNIKGFTLDHSPLPKLEEWTIEEFNAQGTSEHNFSFPPGAVVVIDECQQFFRPRATGSKVPPYVSAFETHRHKGLDFILITQGSGLLDANIRKLVKGGLHIFLRKTFLGRERIEKSEVMNEDDKASYSLGSRRKYKLPADVYHLYKSAELHTKPPRPKLPKAVFVIVGGLLIGAYLAWHTVGRIGGALAKEEAPKSLPVAGSATVAAEPRTGAISASVGVPARIIEAMTPTDAQNPLSAPLYASVAPPVVAPEIQGCIASSKRCTCYSQQQTPVWVPDEQCRQRAAGLYYDPYRQPPPASQTQPLQTSTQSLPGGLARGFDDGTKPDVPRSPVGVSPPSGERVSGAAPV